VVKPRSVRWGSVVEEIDAAGKPGVPMVDDRLASNDQVAHEVSRQQLDERLEVRPEVLSGHA
jgi:hypothetical protein